MLDRKALIGAMRECKETAQDLSAEITALEYKLATLKVKRDSFKNFSDALEPVINTLPTGVDGSAIAGREHIA